jgi:hypothetical protein
MAAAEGLWVTGLRNVSGSRDFGKRVMSPYSERDRILGALKGLATGDAIGTQTEGLSSSDLGQWYPRGIRGFEGAPDAVILRYAKRRS